MKRKIVIGLAVYSAVFLAAGIYIAYTIHTTTANLDKLIRLHQAEILREHYLLQIKRVQSDLTLIDTHLARSSELVVSNFTNMGKLFDTCFDCHHSPRGTKRLTMLKEQTERYKIALERVMKAHPHAPGRQPEEEAAFLVGEELIDQVRDLIDVTSSELGEHTRTAMKGIARAKYILYGCLVLGPLLSGLLGFIFISGLTRPVNVLLESTRKLKRGNLDHRVAGLRDEFGELAVSFNEMAGSLQEQMQKMQRTEQMVVAGELAASLAHEIKNPLAGIKAAMQVLSGEANLSEEDRGVVRRVSQEIVRLESLMKNFLNFAKPAKPLLSEVNVNALINTILAFYVKNQSISPGRPDAVCITKDLQPLPVTMADRMQLQQVLLNLVLNAIDSMPNGGVLNVRSYFEQGPDVIHVEISDTGRGISREHADKIFQPFFTTKPKGTGLGLPISKQFIEQHGGSITVAGNSPGGTVFRIHLPLRTTAVTMT